MKFRVTETITYEVEARDAAHAERRFRDLNTHGRALAMVSVTRRSVEPAAPEEIPLTRTTHV